MTTRLRTLITASVLTLVVVCVFVFWSPNRRDAELIKAFPELTHPRPHGPTVFIRDPLLQTDPDQAGGAAYDKALNTLVDAQNAVATEEREQESAKNDLDDCKQQLLQSQTRLKEARAKWHLFGSDSQQQQEIAKETTALRHWEAKVKFANRRFAAAALRLLRARKAAYQADAGVLAARTSPLWRHRQPFIEHKTVLVMFQDNASIKDIRRLLDRHGLKVRSGLADIRLFVTETDEKESVTDEGKATRLRAIVESLAKESIVEAATQNAVLGTNIIPKPNQPAARNWSATPDDPLVASHFPAAWNFNDAVRNRPPINVGVLDVGFAINPAAKDVPISACCGNAVDFHGTQVASIIGATFDHGGAVDGAAPFVKLFGCAPHQQIFNKAKLPLDQIDILSQKIEFDDLIAGLDKLLAVPVRVVNASIGYNWLAHGVKPDDMSLTNIQGAKARALVEAQGLIVRKKLRNRNVVVVSAAGNDVGRPAKWGSPINWAALADPAAEQSDNVIVVEALKRDNRTRTDDSSVGGTIQAVGEEIPSIASVDASGKEIVQGCSGTSCAAPLVTAVVAQMLAVNPALKPADIKKNLGITTVANAKPLNAFDAVKASSPNPAADLANYDRRDGVGMPDFERFKKDFKDFTAGQAHGGLFHEDLNGDGHPNRNDRRFCRSDFNDDGKIDDADLDIMIQAWTDTSIDPKTLHTILRQ